MCKYCKLVILVKIEMIYGMDSVLMGVVDVILVIDVILMFLVGEDIFWDLLLLMFGY